MNNIHSGSDSVNGSLPPSGLPPKKEDLATNNGRYFSAVTTENHLSSTVKTVDEVTASLKVFNQENNTNRSSTISPEKVKPLNNEATTSISNSAVKIEEVALPKLQEENEDFVFDDEPEDLTNEANQIVEERSQAVQEKSEAVNRHQIQVNLEAQGKEETIIGSKNMTNSLSRANATAESIFRKVVLVLDSQQKIYEKEVVHKTTHEETEKIFIEKTDKNGESILEDTDIEKIYDNVWKRLMKDEVLFERDSEGNLRPISEEELVNLQEEFKKEHLPSLIEELRTAGLITIRSAEPPKDLQDKEIANIKIHHESVILFSSGKSREVPIDSLDKNLTTSVKINLNTPISLIKHFNQQRKEEQIETEKDERYWDVKHSAIQRENLKGKIKAAALQSNIIAREVLLQETLVV